MSCAFDAKADETYVDPEIVEQELQAMIKADNPEVATATEAPEAVSQVEAPEAPAAPELILIEYRPDAPLETAETQVPVEATAPPQVIALEYLPEEPKEVAATTSEVQAEAKASPAIHIVNLEFGGVDGPSSPLHFLVQGYLHFLVQGYFGIKQSKD